MNTPTQMAGIRERYMAAVIIDLIMEPLKMFSTVRGLLANGAQTGLAPVRLIIDECVTNSYYFTCERFSTH